MDVQPSTKVGQGHRDQWLAIFAQCNLPLETPLQSDNHEFRLEEWIQQAEYDVPRNLEMEFSWTLIALTTLRDTNHRWVARDGHEYSTEMLLQSEVQQDLQSSVCGGTHRLIGIAMACNKRRREGRPMTGVWAQASARLDEAIESARRNQNPDGSYSVAYLHRPANLEDLFLKEVARGS